MGDAERGQSFCNAWFHSLLPETCGVAWRWAGGTVEAQERDRQAVCAGARQIVFMCS